MSDIKSVRPSFRPVRPETVKPPIANRGSRPAVSNQMAKPVANEIANPVANQMANPVANQMANPVANQMANPVVAAPASRQPLNAKQAMSVKPATDGVDAVANKAPGADVTSLDSRAKELGNIKNDTIAAERAKEAQANDEAKTPGFFRALLEIFEFVGRFFSPMINMMSAATRLFRILPEMLKGEVDKAELIRLAGDVAGIFFPPAGAIVDAGMDYWFNESEILGGMNRKFDDGEVENPFRHGIEKATEGLKDLDLGDKLKNVGGKIKEVYSDAKAVVTGDEVGRVEVTNPKVPNSIRPLKPAEVGI